MPHIVLEYSDDLDPMPDLEPVFQAIHAVLEDGAGAPVGNSKSRSQPVTSYIGDGDDLHAMVHLDIRLMEGRTEDQKAEVTQRCLALLVDAFADAARERRLQTTVAIADLDRRTYAKSPDGTIG